MVDGQEKNRIGAMECAYGQNRLVWGTRRLHQKHERPGSLKLPIEQGERCHVLLGKTKTGSLPELISDYVGRRHQQLRCASCL